MIGDKCRNDNNLHEVHKIQSTGSMHFDTHKNYTIAIITTWWKAEVEESVIRRANDKT